MISPLKSTFKKRNRQSPPWAYPFYYIPVIIIALIGFGDSIYLAVSHYRNYVDMGYHSFCAITRAVNCDTVSQSPYSIFLGVPVPVWGILGYAFYLFLLPFTLKKTAGKKRVWTLLMLISAIFTIYSVILAFVSSYYIHSYCIMCILSYAVNLALLFYAWIIRNRFHGEGFIRAISLDFIYLKNFSKITIPIAGVFFAGALIMIPVFPPYWHMNPPVLSTYTPTGMTDDGHPWIGAEHPELEIVEFTDYRCFQCKKMHYFLRRLVETHPDKIRLIHWHFPMDKAVNPIVKEPFHQGAAVMALLAIFAAEKGKFWEVNDYLFSISGAFEVHQVAKVMDFDIKQTRRAINDERLWKFLYKDIITGIKDYALTGTPGFIINGKIYEAQIPAEILEPYM